jgi:hypothetical protein
MESLSELLDEAASKFGVRRKLLERIVHIERVSLYLIESSKQSVHNQIRQLVQDEANAS